MHVKDTVRDRGIMRSKATALAVLRVAMKCCGTETEVTPNEASKPIDHGHHEHGTPAKAAESSGCGRTSKESGRPT